MNYLGLVQRLAQKSGTVDRRTISTVQGQLSPRVALLASMVGEAWNDIQLAHDSWRFLTVEIPESSTLDAGISEYTPSDLNIADWAAWILATRPGAVPLTVWPADSPDSETRLVPVGWSAFRASYRTGAARRATGRPAAVSVDTRDRLAVYPAPDGAYRLAGTYRRSPQVLAADTDVPIVLPQYHEGIVDVASLLLDRHDEADALVLRDSEDEAEKAMAALRRRYLTGSLRIGGTPIGQRGGRGEFQEPPGAQGF